ncbi:MAG TPA: adenosylmethionine--8-amino-7-oxononanoate transaminase [Alphaproteobacteria bacterium]|nr:adenosylmethionine--8-amino-7-oxononanoate transaminase [Alphaproteobacteria bacterium]
MSSLLAKDKRHCWHPFTQHQVEPDPPVIVKAKGASLFDEQGNEILDMISSWWTCIHGHAHDEISQALADQAAQLPHVMFAGFTHPAAIQLAEKLAQKLPGDLNRVFYSDNGSTAVEIALKIAYQYWTNKGERARTKFLAFDGGYHGETFGAMAVGKGCGFFKLYDDLTFNVEMLPYVPTWEKDHDVEEREKAALQSIQKTIEKHKHEIAALIVEPLMQGAGGIRFCRPEFMRQVTQMAQDQGILVIYDEIAVGFGRTGALFACEKIGVTPDLICLSKGLTAGYLPLSVTVATDRIFDVFLSDDVEKGFMHSNTFTANPLACAVALKSLEIFDREDSFKKLAHIEKRHRKFLKQLENHHDIFMPRVMGPILAFNISKEKRGYKNNVSEKLRDWFLKNGLNIRPIGDVIYLLPPYCIMDEELDRAYQGIMKGLDEVLLPLNRAA